MRPFRVEQTRQHKSRPGPSPLRGISATENSSSIRDRVSSSKPLPQTPEPLKPKPKTLYKAFRLLIWSSFSPGSGVHQPPRLLSFALRSTPGGHSGGYESTTQTKKRVLNNSDFLHCSLHRENDSGPFGRDSHNPSMLVQNLTGALQLNRFKVYGLFVCFFFEGGVIKPGTLA